MLEIIGPSIPDLKTQVGTDYEGIGVSLMMKAGGKHSKVNKYIISEQKHNIKTLWSYL